MAWIQTDHSAISHYICKQAYLAAKQAYLGAKPIPDSTLEEDAQQGRQVQQVQGRLFHPPCQEEDTLDSCQREGLGNTKFNCPLQKRRSPKRTVTSEWRVALPDSPCHDQEVQDRWGQSHTEWGICLPMILLFSQLKVSFLFLLSGRFYPKTDKTR